MSRVEGLTDAQLKQLRKLTSYSINPKNAYFSGSAYNTTRHLMSKRGEFPTGLLYIVKHWAKQHKHEVEDRRKRPELRKALFSGRYSHTPREEQKAAAEACNRSMRGIVSATTATGKSLMIALTVEKLQVPTLIVVPSLGLKQQLTKTMQEIFGKERVGGLGEALAIENVDALSVKKPLSGYGCVIIDEFHHSGAKTYRDLNRKAWNDVYYKFGFTATPFRSQEHERLLLESVLSKVIYRLDYPTAVSKGYVTPVEAYYIEVPKSETDAHTWQEVYSQLVVNNKERNRLIQSLLKTLATVSRSTLCLVKEISHGHTLASSGIDFANGQDNNTVGLLNAFNSQEIHTLIGTTGVLGEGVDTRPAEYVIIAGLGKSKNQFMQQVGRGLRLHQGKDTCKVVLIKDTSHKFTLRHFAEQCKILKEEYGVIPVKLEWNV